MEDRILVAAAIGLATVASFGWIAFRKFEQRQRFKLRQKGQGKTAELRGDR